MGPPGPLPTDREGISILPIRAPLRSLAHRNFRIYFAAQAASVFGTWIQQVAMSWLVYRLTGSVELLGLTTFCALIPQLVLSPVAGAWSDRVDRVRALILVESLLFLQALLLALLAWRGAPGPVLLIALSALLGVLNSFEGPLRQSLISRLVPGREDLSNAIALNAMLYNVGRLTAPPLAGLALLVLSEAACFAFNAASFLAMIGGLLVLRIPPEPRVERPLAHVFREGLHHAFSSPATRVLLLVLVVSNLTASSYTVLLPVFAREVFAGDSRTLGLLWGAAGGGSLLAAYHLATHRTERRTQSGIFLGMASSAVAMLVFPLTTHLPLAMCAMLALGFGITSTNVGCNITLQTAAPDAMRGRVIAFFSSTRWGFDALGGLLAGFVASRIGAPRTVLVEGAVLLVGGSLLATRRRRLRGGS